MSEIIDGLYVGDDQSYEKAKGRGGWSILRCCKYGPGGHQQTLGYTTLAAPKGPNYLSVRRKNLMALNMIDLDDPNFFSPELVNAGLQFITERREAGDSVLVACNQGHSRGPTMMLMHLRTIGEMPSNFVQSERVFRTLYRHYDPSQGIRQYARSHWSELGAEQENKHGGRQQDL